jgi:hypothetical protein
MLGLPQVHASSKASDLNRLVSTIPPTLTFVCQEMRHGNSTTRLFTMGNARSILSKRVTSTTLSGQISSRVVANTSFLLAVSAIRWAARNTCKKKPESTYGTNDLRPTLATSRADRQSGLWKAEPLGCHCASLEMVHGDWNMRIWLRRKSRRRTSRLQTHSLTSRLMAHTSCCLSRTLSAQVSSKRRLVNSTCLGLRDPCSASPKLLLSLSRPASTLGIQSAKAKKIHSTFR